MADWATIASLATAGGTFVLAMATFDATRSANRAARAAERALLAGLRPVLVSSRLQDLTQKIMWADRHFARVDGGMGYAHHTPDAVYLALSVRNVGRGIAVVRGWFLHTGLHTDGTHRPPEEFRRNSRDLYVEPGDVGFWQGALRDADDPAFGAVVEAIDAREPLTVDVLYADHEEGQQTISRFTLVPVGDEDRWLASVSRHWLLDRET